MRRRSKVVGAALAAVTVGGSLAVGGGSIESAVLAAAGSSIASPTITSAPPAATSSTTASFSFTGPKGATFKCSLDSAAYTACTSPKTYKSLLDGEHSFAVVAVVGRDQSAPAWSRWLVDTVAPPAPTLTKKPSDPTNTATNDFAWTDTDDGATFECSLENGSWANCASPFRWVINDTNYGQHQFAVRARDFAGNFSAATSYKFKYEKGLPESGVPFKITGSVDSLLIGMWKTIPVTVANPNPVPIFVSALQVSVSTTSSCDPGKNVELDPSNISSTNTLYVPANSSVTLPSTTQGLTAPRIRLVNRNVNQDECKGVSFALSYSGTATN